jgi:arylsulfatase A
MKLHLCEGGVRVPGILRWPGRIKPTTVLDEPVCGLDVLPTFCELAGVEIPSDRAIDGASFAPIFEGKPIQRNVPLYWHYFRSIGKPKAAMRVGDWKILGITDAPELSPGSSVHPGDMEILKSSRIVGFELYNLRDDPAEENNLAETEPERLAELSKLLVEKYAQVQAEGPVWDVPEQNRRNPKSP